MYMIKPRASGFVLTTIVWLALSISAAGQTATTTTNQAARISCEVQLQLLIATSDGGEKGNVPQTLEPLVRQLKSSLPATNYRLAAIFINRVKDAGTLQVSGILPSKYFASDPVASGSPVFFEFTLADIKLDTEGGGETFIRIPRFRFSLRVPTVAGITRAEAGTPSYPIINYNPIGINTELSFREAAPTVVGTINTSKPDEVLVLIITVKRSQ
jgi:hypothetical protein